MNEQSAPPTQTEKKMTRNPHPPQTCSTPGCDKPHLAKGLCSTCYYKIKNAKKKVARGIAKAEKIINEARQVSAAEQEKTWPVIPGATISITTELWAKISAIAKMELRTPGDQVMFFIISAIRDYERYEMADRDDYEKYEGAE